MKKLYKCIKKQSPFIFSCIASVGVITTTVLAIKATPKAIELIKEDSRKRHDGDPYAYTAKEAFAVAWKSYIPATAFCLSTIACIMGANALNKRQQTALIGAYAIARNSYKEYQNKLKELYGDEAHKKIMQEITVENAKNADLYAPGLMHCTSLEFEQAYEKERLFYDSMGKRYFTSTISQVLAAEYHLNRNFCLGAIPSLNDFYEFLGLEKTEFGETVGWTNADGEYYWIDFSHTYTEVDGTMECWIIEVDQIPTADYLDDL